MAKVAGCTGSCDLAYSCLQYNVVNGERVTIAQIRRCRDTDPADNTRRARESGLLHCAMFSTLYIAFISKVALSRPQRRVCRPMKLFCLLNSHLNL